MVISNNSHGRKSDKETQSPMLKIFKEIMQRENDPVKVNLLKIKHDRRKEKQHASTRSKSENKSNASEKQRRAVPYNTYVEQRNIEHNPSRESHSVPFQNEKRDSWWYWGESENLEKKEDTCSRVSCAFRRILTSEYVCMGCLLVLFLTSVVLAFFLVFKNIPCLSTSEVLTSPAQMDRESLKRKLEKLKEKRFKNYKYEEDFVGMQDLGDRNEWDDTMPKQADGLSRFADFSNLNDLGTAFEDNSFSNDISNILYNDKITDEQNSERLKNFYKKLIQTDAQIRNLKKVNSEFHKTTVDYNNYLRSSDKFKRSVKRRLPKHTFHFDNKDDKNDKQNKIYPNEKPDSSRKKRFSNNTDEPTGFVIEERKVVVQYTPDNIIEGKRKVPKCSHVPKESKSHEKQLKHPFYKNSQRLDELLDQFLAKNIADDVPDAYELESLFQSKKNACKHPKVKEKEKSKTDIMMSEIKDLKMKKTEDSSLKSQLSSGYNQDLMHRGLGDKQQDAVSTSGYGVVLSVSTLLNPSGRKSVTPSDAVERLPIRKLMQVEEEEEENLGYEDLTEVLADDIDNRDDSDRQEERKKRADEHLPNQIQNPVKYNPPGVHNPNWKGPMPLYPDELNSMIKQAAMNANKIQVPHNNEGSPEADAGETVMNDMEYIEDYLNNKYERLVKMAQAYSDYGVLDGKKESVTNAQTHAEKENEKRIKLAAEKKKLFNKGIFNRWKKASTDIELLQNKRTTMCLQTGLPKREGIRFELRPTSSEREDDPIQVLKLLSKHVKISRKNEINTDPYSAQHITTALPPDMGAIYKASKLNPYDKVSTDRDDERGVIFKIGRGKRSLQSIDLMEAGASVGELFEITSVPNIDYVDRLLKVTEEVVNTTKKERDEDYKNKQVHINDSNKESTLVDLVSKNNVTKPANETKQEMSMSDFLMMLSEWFSFLDAIDNSGNITVPSTSTQSSLNATKQNYSSDVMYPLYDSDMIENIGHRSRVLLSIEDKGANATEEKSETKYAHAGNIVDSVDIAATHKTTKLSNLTTTGVTYPAKPLPETTPNKGLKNKTLVKRNAEDSSLIFWNDIYDDEYGVKMDPMEGALRDKHSVKDRDLLKRPRVWFQEKFKKLKDKIGGDKTSEGDTNVKARPMRDLRNLGAETNQKDSFKTPNKLCKRNAVMMEDDLDPNRNIDFAHLTANMKSVCKKAARAVQQTRNIEVREDAKEGSVATSLMQQLVRLMTDLVDYQVQQKTCLKLPPDLSNFLEWLTSPAPDQQLPGSFKSSQHFDDMADIISMSMDEDVIPSSSEKEEARPDTTRSECLGTLKAVQELIHQYDAMSDEDKSKMTGVREYLDSQIEYLNRQLANTDVYGGNLKRNIPNRYKRDVSKKCQKRKHKSIRKKRRPKRKMQKFIKNFGKKHTRTTAGYYETLQMTDSVRNDKIRSKNDDIEQDGGKSKRNLKDVYYKALADSKKITTIKDMNKKLDISDINCND